MIISQASNGISLSWRDFDPDTGEQNVRWSNFIKYEDFPPFFYIKNTEFKPENFITTSRWGKTSVVEVRYEEGDYVNLQGEKLTKVYCKHPSQVPKVRREFSETYEADVLYTHRYAIEKIDEMPEYEMRKWYWDMEWQQGGEHDGAITCIVAYDNYKGEFYRWSWTPTDLSNIEKDKYKYDKYGKIIIEPEASVHRSSGEWYNVRDYRYPKEIHVLSGFITTCLIDDPDMLISWFGNKFDLPKLLERCVANNLDGRLLSPIFEVDGFVQSNNGYKFKKTSFSSIEQPVKGRICLSLDLAFERQWNDAQKGTLPSLALDYVSDLVLGEKKLVSEKFPDKQDFFRRAWLEDTETYLEYALIDVDLIRRLDEENYLSEAIISLQRLLKAPFDACFYASHMGSIYFMRNAWWKAPTRDEGTKSSYQGAMIFDPLVENTNGLHTGVAAFDFAGLYPSVMVARNISWETKSDEPTDFAVNIATPRDFSDVTNKNMLYYKTDELGVLPKAVMELNSLRTDYKNKMKKAKTDREYNKWDNNQMAVKRLRASFYGIIGYQGFGWADTDLAASITASAREAIREAAFTARKIV